MSNSNTFWYSYLFTNNKTIAYRSNNANKSLQTKSVYEKASIKGKLPRIISIDSRQYKNKLSRVWSKVDTGLSLTSQEVEKSLYFYRNMAF